MRALLPTLLIMCALLETTTAYNILGLFVAPVRSHYVFLQPLMTELAKRNHTLTLYSVFPFETQNLPNFSTIDVKPCFPVPLVGHFSIAKFFEWSTLHILTMMNNMLIPTYERISNCSQVMELVRSNVTYDAFITDYVFPEWFTVFAYKFNAPLINVFPNVLFPYVAGLLGAPVNPSYTPYAISIGTQRMNFYQRLVSFCSYAVVEAARGVYLKDPTDDLVWQVFGPEYPSAEDVVRNTSLTLMNTDLAYYQSTFPLVPSIVGVGGLHITNASSIPQNIEKFINESQHGVVYFCMGSLLRGETFPEEKRNAFLYAFSKIPQRVLWKWEGEVLPGKSDNIMISKWMPQRDILAHPNVKLFISHGGLLGTSEAVYEGVPVLGIPIFGDQRTNIKSLEANGAGELLDYNEITKDVVLEKIQRLLNDPKYKENAKQLSARYRDRPMSPLDTAVYWTEYVIRHKGAPHLRTAAADMPWYQYLLLDVIAFLILVTVSALAILYYSIKFTLRFLCNLICGKKSSSKPAAGKKVKRN